jgi:glycosyltransferase involved in cell wall biosynthesis
MSVRYSIILPAFNEGSRIVPGLEKALAFLREQGWKAEIIVVNDGSSDNTDEVVRDFIRGASELSPQQAKNGLAGSPELRLLENPGNRGKGYSVRHGMLNARGQVLLFSDADFSSPIAECVKLIAAIEQGADVAFGSRWLLAETQTRRQSLLRQFVGRAYNLLSRLLLGLPYKDMQCGLKAFSRRAAEIVFTRQHIERWGFDPELLFIARQFGLKMKEVPVEWAHDDRSKINPIVDGIKMFWELLRIRMNGLAGRYEHPTFHFVSETGDPGPVMVEGPRPA